MVVSQGKLGKAKQRFKGDMGIHPAEESTGTPGCADTNESVMTEPSRWDKNSAH